MEDFGLEGIMLVKVAAHKSRARVVDGSAGMTFRDWAGNRAADQAAKAGAKLHPTKEGMGEAIADAQVMGRAVAKWLGVLGAYMVGLKSPDV